MRAGIGKGIHDHEAAFACDPVQRRLFRKTQTDPAELHRSSRMVFRGGGRALLDEGWRTDHGVPGTRPLLPYRKRNVSCLGCWSVFASALQSILGWGMCDFYYRTRSEICHIR
ncbi:hypothetical protein L596_003482 [Steinernema carpocapsae]|uniref:Uncharacterized protein n=1 Tax=Steinernema carpocapsae TaxID=34508 RepID=A0A4U8UTS2_STECR|nr:hypothetical protein L596_003482 [Steinernema carpocapsae]